MALEKRFALVGLVLVAACVAAIGHVSLAGVADKVTTTAPEKQGPREPTELVVEGKVVGRVVESRPGDVCLVCNEPLQASDGVYVVRGQRVPVHLGACDAKLRAEPQSFLAQLLPRGAFLDAATGQGRLSRAWFFAGSYVLAGLLFAALCAHRALHVGRSPAAWFGTGLILNALGYVTLLALPRRTIQAPGGIPGGLGKVAATYAPEPCTCGATNHPSASECIGCGARLEPRMVSEVARTGLRPT